MHREQVQPGPAPPGPAGGPPPVTPFGSWLAGIDVDRLEAHPGPDPTVTTLPDTATTLIVRRTPGGRQEVMVAGPRTRALYHWGGEPGLSCLQLRIQPGRARPLVGRSLTDLTDRIVPLTAPDLADELLALLDRATWARLEAALARWLVPTSANDRARSELVARATSLLSSGSAGVGVGVAAVARRLHVSERQLRNLFAQAVGLSPKQFARIDRVRTVLAQGPHDGLARAATGAGYYDQPHMTAEFRRLMGVPPGAFLAGRLPSPSPCAHQG
jgi:AraC-like DNA-binding protein